MRFRKAMIWPKAVEQFISMKSYGLILHVCSGSSNLGHVKVDLYKKADVRADAFHLPFRRVFDTVICDPPWRLPIHLRPKLLYELRDTTKDRLIINAPFAPTITNMNRKEIWLGFSSSIWRDVRLVTIYEVA